MKPRLRAGMASRLATAALLTAALAALAPAAAAAELPEPPGPDQGYREYGAFYLRPGLALRNLGYDSNIFFSPDDAVGDYTATLTPRLESVNLFGHRGRLNLAQQVDLVGFWEYSSQNHANSLTQAEGLWLAGDFLLTGLFSYDSQRLRPSEEISERIRQKIGTLGGRIEWSKSEQAGAALYLGRERYKYQDGTGEFGTSYTDLNRDETTVAVDLHHRLRPKTDVTLALSRTDIAHARSDLDRDGVINRLQPGFRMDASAFLQGEFRYGLLEFTPDEADRAGYSGPGGRGELTYRPLSRLRLLAGYDRDVVFSIFGDDLFYLRQRLSLEATTPLSRRFWLSAGAARTDADYSTPVASPQFTGVRADKIDEIWIGWSYTIPGRPRIGFRVVSWDRTSNFGPANTEQIRIVGEARYEF